MFSPMLPSAKPFSHPHTVPVTPTNKPRLGIGLHSIEVYVQSLRCRSERKNQVQLFMFVGSLPGTYSPTGRFNLYYLSVTLLLSVGPFEAPNSYIHDPNSVSVTCRPRTECCLRKIMFRVQPQKRRSSDDLSTRPALRTHFFVSLSSDKVYL